MIDFLIERRAIILRKKSLLYDIYIVFRRACKALSNKFKIFKEIDKVFTDIEKSIVLLNYTKEWLILIKEKFCFIEVDGILYPTVETIKDLHDFLVIKYEKDIDKILGMVFRHVTFSHKNELVIVNNYRMNQ